MWVGMGGEGGRGGAVGRLWKMWLLFGRTWLVSGSVLRFCFAGLKLFEQPGLKEIVQEVNH